VLGGLRLGDRSRVENELTGTGAMELGRVRSTRPDKVARGIRVVLGVLFVMTGAMKLVVPMLAAAWAGQLAAANIPLPELNRSVVPFVEMGVGAALLIGFHTRIATLLVLSIMAVATYVHLVVHDPELFPMQPAEPIIPAVVMILAAYLLVKGGGSGTLDLRATEVDE
jgi:putative oxidoreductase